MQDEPKAGLRCHKVDAHQTPQKVLVDPDSKTVAIKVGTR